MRPEILQLVEQIDIAKRTEDVAHQPGLSNRFLDRIKPRPHGPLCAHNTRNRTRHFAQHIVRPRHRFLPRSHGLRELLRARHPRVDQRHRHHPDAVLHAGREHRDLGEDTLVRRAREDLVRIAFRAAVRPDDGDRGAQILDKVPACTGDGEQVQVVRDVSEDLKRRVVLEEKIHLDADAADVFEHVGELHVVRVRAESVESATVSNNHNRKREETYIS